MLTIWIQVCYVLIITSLFLVDDGIFVAPEKQSAP